jgi:hypothetical protein
MKKPLIPFNWLPASWGLKGKTREIAQAEYELTGMDLDLKLIDIEYKTDPERQSREKLKVLKNYGKLTQSEYEYEVLKYEISDSIKREMAVLDLDLKNKKIDAHLYEKKKASLNKEPWVSMPKIHWDPLNNGKTFFELDYNEYFIPYLKDNNYSGSDDEIINAWLNDICLSITQETGISDSFILPANRPDMEDNSDQT